MVRWIPPISIPPSRPAQPRASQPPSLAPDGDAVWVASESGLDPAAGRLRVTMVDVGRGDGFLIEFPNGKVMAVDGGPSTTKFENHLKSRGITRLDYAVLSHGHNDHYTGLTPVLDMLPSDCAPRVFDPGLNRRDVAGYNSFRSAAGCHYQAIALGASLLSIPRSRSRCLGPRSLLWLKR